ncbi:hypothetical protein Tco_0627402 [Tanacetum coccineum]|uniref:Uncharacterized protein n=1 Tax=Tanacetum coccineum TaxID=301880 RepID=A0ABQ4WMC8_9ASTR
MKASNSSKQGICGKRSMSSENEDSSLRVGCFCNALHGKQPSRMGMKQPVDMKPPAFATHHLAAAANCLACMSGLKKVRGGLLPVEQPPCSMWSSQRRGTTSLRQWPLVTRRVGGHGRAWSGSQYKHLTRIP